MCRRTTIALVFCAVALFLAGPAWGQRRPPELPAPPKMFEEPAPEIGLDGLLRSRKSGSDTSPARAPGAAQPAKSPRAGAVVRNGSTLPRVSFEDLPATLALMGGFFAVMYLFACVLVWLIRRPDESAEAGEGKDVPAGNKSE